jgi:hypothetical protein
MRIAVGIVEPVCGCKGVVPTCRPGCEAWMTGGVRSIYRGMAMAFRLRVSAIGFQWMINKLDPLESLLLECGAYQLWPVTLVRQ